MEWSSLAKMALVNCELGIHQIVLLGQYIKVYGRIANSREVRMVDVFRGTPPLVVRGLPLPQARSGRTRAFQPEDELLL
jgi:hypothetical protein